MKDDFYKDIRHKRTQGAEPPKGKNKNKVKKDDIKEDGKKQEEQPFKRSAKYKDQKQDDPGQFSKKIKGYFNRENLEKSKAFFAGKLSTYNERFSDELKVTKEKIDEFRNRPKKERDAAEHDGDDGSGKNKGLIPMIVGGAIIVPVTLILGFLIISNFWPSNDGMELATDESDTEEAAEPEDEELNEELDEQRFEMEKRLAESRGEDGEDEADNASEDGEEIAEERSDLASESVEVSYSDEELSILEDIAGDAIEEKEGGEDIAEEPSEDTEEESAEEAETEDPAEDEETAEDDEETESVGAAHVVGEDDNLFQIAKRYYGDGSPDNVQRIRDANGISGNNISVGQELIIP